MNRNSDAIEILTKMLIEENFKNKTKKYIKMTKEDLIKFSIKLIKEIEMYN